MAFEDFPSQLYFKTLDTSEKVNAMNFSTARDSQLKYARVMIYINGITISTEQMRVNINPSESNENPIFSSSWSDLSDITYSGDNWVGWLRFDFAEQHIDKDITYTAQIETNNYTRNGDTEYLGIAFDWPNYVNDQAVEAKPSIGIELYGLE